MSSGINARQSRDGINYLDYSEFVGVPCGIVMRNDGFGERQIDDFILHTIAESHKARDRSTDANPKLIKLNQKHTNNIVFSADYDNNMPADGVFSTSGNHILTVRTADCFPVLISDGKIVGIIHAGWRSALLGIIKNFFERVKIDNPENWRVVIGPGIGACCFEVSSEVAILFNKKYRTVRNNRYYIDVRRLIVDDIKEYGVKYIMVDDACTSCNVDKFYSYRREGTKVKQMLSYIYSGG